MFLFIGKNGASHSNSCLRDMAPLNIVIAPSKNMSKPPNVVDENP